MVANNIQIGNIGVSGNQIRFNLSWEHSWYNGEQHDAAWIFVKIKLQDENWQTLPLNSLQAQSENAVFDFKSPQNQSGIMVMPRISGDKNIISDTLIISASLPNANFELKIFGIEMVYVPEGAFYLGDCISQHSFCHFPDSTAFYITGEQPIKLTTIGNSPIMDTLPPTYPKGFAGFYAMKYEISQQQYTDFLNTLTGAQQQAHIRISVTANAGSRAFAANSQDRNGIVLSVPSENGKPAIFACNANNNTYYNEPNDAQTRAMNWLAWSDLAAYLDWAGLRPLSELEFEKLARGTIPPVAGEFAWGTPYVTDANTVENDGTENEKVSETGNDTIGLANHGYQGLQGALRCGFAAGDISKRTHSGSGFYGAKELSGNVWEICISANFTTFANENGDGELDAQGYANTVSWCKTDAKGTIYRGGAWSSGIYEVGSWRDLAVSDRYYYYLYADTPRNTTGGRGGISLK